MIARKMRGGGSGRYIPLRSFSREFSPDNASVVGHLEDRNCVHHLSRREIRSQMRRIREKEKNEKREASLRSEKIMEKQNTGSAMFIALVRDTLDKRNPS